MCVCTLARLCASAFKYSKLIFSRFNLLGLRTQIYYRIFMIFFFSSPFECKYMIGTGKCEGIISQSLVYTHKLNISLLFLLFSVGFFLHISIQMSSGKKSFRSLLIWHNKAAAAFNSIQLEILTFYMECFR